MNAGAGATVTTLAELAASVDQVQHELSAVVDAVGRLARGQPVDAVPEERRTTDSLWLCGRCGKRVGVYDQAADVLRIKYRDLYLQVHVGGGGWVETPCLSCGHVNRAADEPAR